MKNTTKAKTEVSYFSFLFRKQQLTHWLVVILTTLFGVLLMVHWFPLPGAVNDSNGYVFCALRNKFLPYRPFGYSAFLRFIHIFSDSVGAVVIFQAIIYALSTGMAAIAIQKYWPPRKKWFSYLIDFLLALNLPAIFMINTIMSDVLLFSMTVIIVVMIIVYVKEKSLPALLIYLGAFYAALFTRYSSMFYPFAFIPVLLLCGKKSMRVISCALTLAVFLVFYSQTRDNMYKADRLRQFSTGFDGWQLANNAMHVLPYIDETDGMPKDRQLRQLHNYCLHRYDSLILQRTRNGKALITSFMWDDNFPLKRIARYNMQLNKVPYQREWVLLGSGLYSDYGKWLITHFPGKFCRYYLFINLKYAFFPDKPEMIGNWVPLQTTQKEMAEWFDLSKVKADRTGKPGFCRYILPIIPYIELLTWILLLGSVILILTKKRLSAMSGETRIILLALFLSGFIYYASTVFAAPIVLRYWMPMHVIKLLFVWISLRESKLL